MPKKKKEEDLFSVRNSRKIYIPIYIMVLVLIGVVIWIYFSEKPLTYFSIALVILFSYFAIKLTEIHRLTNKYSISSSALIHTVGLFNKREKRVDLGSISDIDIIQTLWQRIWRYGDVCARLFSTESMTIVKSIDDPKKFAKFLESKMLPYKRGI